MCGVMFGWLVCCNCWAFLSMVKGKVKENGYKRGGEKGDDGDEGSFEFESRHTQMASTLFLL